MSYSSEGANRITDWTTLVDSPIPQALLDRCNALSIPTPPGNTIGTYNPGLSTDNPSCIAITTMSKRERSSDSDDGNKAAEEASALNDRITAITGAISKAISFGDITLDFDPASQAGEVTVNTSYMNGSLTSARFRESDLNPDGTIIRSAPGENLTFPQQVIDGVARKLMRCTCIREIDREHGNMIAHKLVHAAIDSVFAAVRHTVATKCDFNNVAHNIRPGSHNVTTVPKSNLVNDTCDYAVFGVNFATQDLSPEDPGTTDTAPDTDEDSESDFGNPYGDAKFNGLGVAAA